MKNPHAYNQPSVSHTTVTGGGPEQRVAARSLPLADGKQAETSKPGTARLQSSPEQNLRVFRFTAPKARSVKLAADFTNWEKLPLKLHRDKDGVWEVKVPLSPGRYGYRFLVDGQWQDDPQCTRSEPNPFGSTNAIAEVK